MKQAASRQTLRTKRLFTDRFPVLPTDLTLSENSFHEGPVKVAAMRIRNDKATSVSTHERVRAASLRTAPAQLTQAPDDSHRLTGLGIDQLAVIQIDAVEHW